MADAAAIESVGLEAVSVAVSVVSPEGELMLKVFVSATVVLIEPVITPLAFVVPLGCVSTFPLPVDAKLAADPETGFEY